MGDTGDANVEMLILMLLLSLKLNHTTTYPILIMPDIITLVKDQLMPNLSHGVVTVDMEGTGAASVALLKLNPNHGDMEDMVDTGDRTKKMIILNCHDKKSNKLMDPQITILV